MAAQSAYCSPGDEDSAHGGDAGLFLHTICRPCLIFSIPGNEIDPQHHPLTVDGEHGNNWEQDKDSHHAHPQRRAILLHEDERARSLRLPRGRPLGHGCKRLSLSVQIPLNPRTDNNLSSSGLPWLLSSKQCLSPPPGS